MRNRQTQTGILITIRPYKGVFTNEERQKSSENIATMLQLLFVIQCKHVTIQCYLGWLTTDILVTDGFYFF